MPLSGNRVLWFFLLGWTLLNLLQSGWTALDPDEAYYWAYSHQLAWGYFDHPPAIALMIRLGSSLLPGELGLRFMTVLFQTGSFYLIWLLADRPRDVRRLGLLMILFAAMPLLVVYGFIATPDGPLLFFTALFFYLYRRFLERSSWTNTLWLGTCMAALLYSKYHGILIIGFTVISNPRVFLHPRFWIASVFGAALFLPHLYWQYANDFPSFRYHLKGRDDVYEFKYTYTYVLNQLVLYNPLVFPFTVVALLRLTPAAYLPQRKLERAYYFLIIGFWAFFFWTTFKGHVEPQWTAVLSIPFILLTFRYSAGHPVFEIWLRRLALAGALLLLLARVILVLNVWDFRTSYEKIAWIPKLAEQAKGAPILFISSYTDPSLYWFYTGRKAYSLTTVTYRKNQYDLWDGEELLQDQRVLVVNSREWACRSCEPVEVEGWKKNPKWVDSLQVIQKVRLKIVEEARPWVAGNRQQLVLEIHNPYPHDIRLDAGDLPLQAAILFEYSLEKWKFAYASLPAPGGLLPAGQTIRLPVSIRIPPGTEGVNRVGGSLKAGSLEPSYPAHLEKIEILPQGN